MPFDQLERPPKPVPGRKATWDKQARPLKDAALPDAEPVSPSAGSAAPAALLDAELRNAHPTTIIEAAVAAFGERLALVSSFGAESAVLLHLAAQVKRDIPVLFLDTGMLFGQTLDYRRQLATKLGLTDVRDLRPRFQDLAVGDPDASLWKTDTDACCNIRKVLPLDRALEGFDGWLTGRKRFHGGDRLRLAVVEQAEHQVKFNPLANWGKEELDAYVARHDLPAHPLVAQGFPSIGCWPCTSAVEEGADVRAGRWAGQDKTECGIHVARANVAPTNVGGDI
jgi:phosphoadenosine phosphosulfate reductase